MQLPIDLLNPKSRSKYRQFAELIAANLPAGTILTSALKLRGRKDILFRFVVSVPEFQDKIYIPMRLQSGDVLDGDFSEYFIERIKRMIDEMIRLRRIK